MSPLSALTRSPLWSQPPLAIVADVVVAVAFVLVAVAIILDFRNYYWQSEKVVRSDRSFVETGSMTAFFVVYYLVVKFRVLDVAVPASAGQVLIALGVVLVVAGVVFNVWGRLVLKSRWANQIKIFEGHTLATTGPFAVVRHPLYASLIWIFAGGSLIYSNPLSALLTLGVFVPMMYVRAKKEDALLEQSFADEFRAYRARTGMFLPRIGSSPWTT
jgi:protein-S-isoprenylcysteine O-methyltransferase Ste14